MVNQYMKRLRVGGTNTRARLIAQRYKSAVIRKEKGEYCVRSPNNPKWNGGCFPTKEEAEDRLKEVEFFKHKK